MNCLFKVNAIVAAALILISAAVADAKPSHPLDEDAAVALLERTLKRDGFYEKRISLGCISYDTEEKTKAYFQFVLREIHNAKCGGDPEVSPAFARYRVYRQSGKIQQWEAAEDSWHPYTPRAK